MPVPPSGSQLSQREAERTILALLGGPWQGTGCVRSISRRWTPRTNWRWPAVFLIVGAWVTSPAAALGYSAAPGYAAHDYATAFPSQSDGRGPIGLAFDQVDRLFVIDVANSQLYSFLPAGGQASSATQVSHAPIPALPPGAPATFPGPLD